MISLPSDTERRRQPELLETGCPRTQNTFGNNCQTQTRPPDRHRSSERCTKERRSEGGSTVTQSDRQTQSVYRSITIEEVKERHAHTHTHISDRQLQKQRQVKHVHSLEPEVRLVWFKTGPGCSRTVQCKNQQKTMSACRACRHETCLRNSKNIF